MDTHSPKPLKSIMVIEDDPQFGHFLREFLESKNYVVHLFDDGATALEQCATCKPDLVVTDVFVPNQDGIEIVKALLEVRPDLPIIAISGSSDESFLYLRVTRTLGARATLEKPFAGPDLLDTIERLLNEPVSQS